VWFPPRKRFRPYADGGVGTALFFLPQASVENALAQGVKLRDSWAFLVNCGGGFKYLIRDQFAVTVDVKDRLFKIPSYGLPLSVHGVGQTWQANVGLTFQWDEY
jgi:outer membrane protein W